MVVNPQRPIYVQQTGRAVTRNRRSGSWHFGQILLTLCSGGLWAPVYWWKWMKGRSRMTVTTYRR